MWGGPAALRLVSNWRGVQVDSEKAAVSAMQQHVSFPPAARCRPAQDGRSVATLQARTPGVEARVGGAV